jgi:hypothetical protein
MIRFSLRCEAGHEFEAWFSRNADFEDQQARDLVACPHCGSAKVAKALMAPQVATSRAREEKKTLAMHGAQAEQLAKIKEMVRAIRDSSEDVGERFPEEARKIHYGEAEERGIIGKADAEEARALIEEGIALAPLPVFPDEAN